MEFTDPYLMKLALVAGAALATVGIAACGHAPVTAPARHYTDYLQMIRVDAVNTPTWQGEYLHWVEVSSNPNMTEVAQWVAGGAYPTLDCGEADIVSVLNDRGVHSTVSAIEGEAGGGATGTTAAQLVQALAASGVHAHVEHGTAPKGYVMNPGGGPVDTPANYLIYSAASANEFVVVG